MRKIAPVRKMICQIAVMRKMVRKMMRKIVFMRKMMRKMKISSSEGEYSRSEPHKTFKKRHLLIKALLFRIGPIRFRRNHAKC